MLRRIAIGLVLALLVALPATAQDYQQGWAAGKRGDYATALREWRPLAEQGHTRAQYNLGVMYHKGRGVPQDYVEATKWYRKAGEQGHALAQYNLAFLYTRGHGIPPDYAEAVKWFRKAAEQGFVPAQYDLGAMYEKGWGVPQDHVSAHMWLSLAAARGYKKFTEARDHVAKKMTPAQITEAWKLAGEWRAKHKKK